MQRGVPERELRYMFRKRARQRGKLTAITLTGRESAHVEAK